MKTTTTFKKTSLAFNTGKRFTILQGGARSGKTMSTIQILFLLALHSEKPLIISIVSESMPHLKRGALRDFKTMIKEEGVYSDSMYNKTDHIFTIGKSIIEFFSADTSDKVRGPGRDYLFCNEVNNIGKETFTDLVVRTNEQIIVDFNPVSEFYIHTDYLTRPSSEYEFFVSTYKDNEYLNPNLRKEIESRREIDPNWWKVYGLGQIGSLEGMVFSNWRTCDSMPETDKRSLGMDFGFSVDPSTLIDIRIQNGELWLNEIMWQSAMTNPEIAKFVKDEELLSRSIIGDSSEPKSIEELSRMGLKIKGAAKGADSIRHGINWMKSFPVINITKRSVNLIKEFRNYKWKMDSNGNPTNVPIDIFNHGIDAVRYGGEVFQKPELKAKYSF